MIEPNERSAGEIEQMVEGMDFDISDEMTEGVVEAAKDYIEKMRDAGNMVMQNPHGQPIVEIIAPRGHRDQMQEVFDEWDLNPSGAGTFPQPPSFSDDKPDIAKGLTSWQFLLEEDSNQLSSCGFDLEQIIEECEDMDEIDHLYTSAARVGASLPVE